MISRYSQRFGIYVFCVAIACVYYLANSLVLLGHYDLGWHLAAGDLIRAQRSIPFHDSWSFTAGERQWYNLSWLWDVFASVVFQYGGFTGLIILVVCCGGIIVGYLTFACRVSGAQTIATCIAVLLSCSIYPAFSAYPNIYLAASPNVSTMLFGVIFYVACLRREVTFVLPAIMVLWANLHGGFSLGFIIIGVFGIAALWKRNWVDVRSYGVAGVGCLVATLINPLGWRIYEGLTTVLGHFSQAHITEWWSYFENISLPGSIPGIMYILVFVAFEARHKSTAPLESRLLSWLFLFLGFYQFRYLSFFFIFSTVPFALHLDQLLSKQLDESRIHQLIAGVGIAALCALPLIYLRVGPALELPQMLSMQDIQWLRNNVSNARVLNHWNYGGILIFHARGVIPVFVDGRAATAYPDSVLHDYFKLSETEVDEAAWDTVVQKYQISAILWVRAHEELRQFLVGRRGWKEAYDGSYATVYLKQ